MKKYIGAIRVVDGHYVNTVLPMVVFQGKRVFHASQFNVLPADSAEDRQVKIHAHLGSTRRDDDIILFHYTPGYTPEQMVQQFVQSKEAIA